MPESVVEERSNLIIEVRGSKIYDSEANNFNNRTNGKAIDNSNALTATAKRV
jgi:hypothetical protein